jgi:hypothetical protein
VKEGRGRETTLYVISIYAISIYAISIYAIIVYAIRIYAIIGGQLSTYTSDLEIQLRIGRSESRSVQWRPADSFRVEYE